ncbi:hypothetical protein JZ751_005561 [Albula glossodonta]|uniref:ubiquitinyl hydrolase 1 n=1 Tax=Albula glossodonta TaxID=121402 RepID=A0A8T2NBR6_9TELE|nr:hypothetical protein JZ751_005561 [Albula glossodonta]
MSTWGLKKVELGLSSAELGEKHPAVAGECLHPSQSVVGSPRKCMRLGLRAEASERRRGACSEASLEQRGNTGYHGDVLALKEHLIEELDYILVPTEGWNKLVSWYGLMDTQEPIARKVVEQGTFVKHCKVEVYLTELKLCEDSNMDNVVTRCFSKADTIDTIEKEMRKLFSIPDEKETRLWNKYMSNTFGPLSNPSSTVQDAGLYQGQVLVIEQKHEDGTWPRGSSAPKSKHKTSHSLELGHDKKGPRKQSVQELEDLVLDKLPNVLVIEQKNEDGTWPRGSSAPKNEHKTSHSLELAHYKEGPRKQSVQELEDLALDKLPNICSHYNRGNGEHGSCKFTDCCTSLHVCQHFLQDNCKFGAQCKRAHKFDATAIKILNGRGVYLDLHALCMMYKKTLAFTAQANGPTKKCVQVHYHLPYRWQVLDKDGTTWKDLPDMESIEQAYCNPANNSRCYHYDKKHRNTRHFTGIDNPTGVDTGVLYSIVVYSVCVCGCDSMRDCDPHCPTH